ncbi:uncharacterized protein EKO05_0009535 [Ascochyta rabiei]|uniref:uncharacterized protein n=1 Tax=Didymella rabiei TaxID=5454 RepID=UPI00220C1179|nr:uncharacterized protein EKO05_0009535 [Ascochyta rabiei]UPX19266.1 hypothetical protein EKO05_0009535 [Ascochyta rabiei]
MIDLIFLVVLMIYVDSILFVLASSIIVHGLGINSSRSICEAGIFLCLICYMTTKILMYYFLVERAYIARGSLKPRLKTKLWLFNCLFMILPYTVFVVMNFIWRITYIKNKGMCIIGMQKIAMLPLIIFEVVVNIYLTLLFILPLRKLYSYKNNVNPKLNRMAFRSLVGSLATLTTSIANLTVLMVLRGEPGWVCLMCCNADILFCVLVLHWMTSKDKPVSSTSTYASNNKISDAPKYAHASSHPTQHNVRMEKQGAVQSETTEIAQYDVPSSKKTAGPSMWPCNAAPTSSKLPGTITTEICSGQAPVSHSKSQSRRGLHKSTDGGECGDEMKLHSIHVHREVCIDSGSSVSESSFGEHGISSPWTHSVEDAWGMKRSVSADKMV